ncbi:hypothetical protein FHR72_003822 [Mycolicibacterium iranicum]|uniref:ANTAR domain-containing protein n=1 Tax=Mycolicibacterium iranicum TaxID=912594 RepID=A0A839Q9U7_MYCIR|nr:ANTAR domain-containing protein [Mycolicibacterium iranicum]MBB2992323.1 hypothetical protein [Mycolicibacterium iranicum]
MGFSGTGETSRQAIDIAVGILIGLRGCSRSEAFDELVRVVHQTGIGLGSVASGLVALATGTSSVDHAEAFTAWGELIRGARPASLVSAS